MLTTVVEYKKYNVSQAQHTYFLIPQYGTYCHYRTYCHTYRLNYTSLKSPLVPLNSIVFYSLILEYILESYTINVLVDWVKYLYYRMNIINYVTPTNCILLGTYCLVKNTCIFNFWSSVANKTKLDFKLSPPCLLRSSWLFAAPGYAKE